MTEPDYVDNRVSTASTERPSYTCPWVNEAQESLDAADRYVDKARTNLESLRTMNEQLRSNAEEWEELARGYYESAVAWQAHARHLMDHTADTIMSLEAENRRLAALVDPSENISAFSA